MPRRGPAGEAPGGVGRARSQTRSTARRRSKSAAEPPLPLLSPLINQAFYYTRRAFDEAARDYGITASQLGVLRRIAEDPGITGAELSRRMFTTPQAAQLMLTTLERKRLVERKPDPTWGRIVRSYLTDDGRKLFNACITHAYDIEQQLGMVLTSEERQTLIDLLERYVHQMPAD